MTNTSDTPRPLLRDYFDKWSIVAVSPHEQERSAREDFAMADRAWLERSLAKRDARIAALEDALKQPLAQSESMALQWMNRALNAETSLASLSARNAELEGALAEAIEDIESWGAYASQYFQDKHDLAGCLASHRAALAAEQTAHSKEDGE